MPYLCRLSNANSIYCTVKPITKHIAPWCFSYISLQRCFSSLLTNCRLFPPHFSYWLSASHVIDLQEWYKNTEFQCVLVVFSPVRIELPAHTLRHVRFTFLFNFNDINMPKGCTSTGKGEKNMPKGCTYTGEEATQKVLNMSTDMDTEQSDHNTSTESSVDSEPDEYMDTVLCRDAVKRVYSRKRGHTDSSVSDKEKMSDDSFEFQDDELQKSPPCTLQNLCSLHKRLRSGSPSPSTSVAMPPMRHTSMPVGLGGDVVSSTLSPIPRTSSMPTHLCRRSNPGNASECGTPLSAVLKCPQRTSTPVASAPVKRMLTSAMRRHTHRSSTPISSSLASPKCPPRASMPSDSGSELRLKLGYRATEHGQPGPQH